MRKIAFYVAVALVTCLAGFSACTRNKDKEAEVVKVDPTSEETANKIRQTLRAPIDKARQAQDLGEERTNAIDEATKRQQ
jgi:hypothetical protein